MAEFENQGGVANSEPSPLLRFFTSKLMKRLASKKVREAKRAKAEKTRLKQGQAHVLEYFHQTDDPYSHLAAQALQPLLEQYNIELKIHLVELAGLEDIPEPKLLQQYGCYDAALVAPTYGLDFPLQYQTPEHSLVGLANAVLAAMDRDQFVAAVSVVGQALWSGGNTALQVIADREGIAGTVAIAEKIDAGSARRKKLGHYLGAMFFYAGEWYWGVDRLYHLEQRLIALGVSKTASPTLLFPRPEINCAGKRKGQSLTLEVFASLRSPYTSIIFDQAVNLAREADVAISLRPVLPMVMRGVPATRQKGFYIFFDTAREAETLGLSWGNACDPIGEPVRRVYSLFPWALTQGKGVALIRESLKASFFDAINVGADKGLKTVVERAGLSWAEAQPLVGSTDYEAVLEDNRLAMYEFNSWGVPSFRLLDESGESIIAVWGQDRLWRLAQEL